MPSYTVMALTNPVEGREDEYNRWFEEAHMPEVLALTGFLSAQRLEVAAHQIAAVPLPYRYICLYEVESDDIERTLADLGRAARSGTPTDASDTARRVIWVYAPRGGCARKGGAV